jgi:predicted PurR-regulated permease PerM
MSNKDSTLPGWVPRLIGVLIVSSLATIAAIYIVLQISDLLIWVVVALFLSFAIEPVVNQLVHRGWSRTLATTIAVFLFFGVITILVAAMIPLIIQQVTEVVKQSPEWLTSFLNFVNSIANTNITQQDILNNISGSNQLVSDYITDIAGNVFVFGKQLLYLVIQILAVILFTFYFVLDGPYLRRVICSLLSEKHQKLMLSTWELAIEKTGGFMVSRLMLGGLSAVAHYIVLVILGVPFALPLALWMGIVSQFVPIFGTYIAAALPLVVALLQSPSDAAILLVFIVIYQQIENLLIGPKISSQTMELHPAVAFAAIIAGASIGGPVGAFIALPVAAIIQEILKVYLGRYEVIETRLTNPNSLKRKHRKVSKKV